MKMSWPRRWSELSRVERVDLYTRQSLFASLWLFCGILLLTSAPETTSDAQRAAFLGGGFAVTALGSLAMTAVISSWAANHRLPWLRLGLLVFADGAYVATTGLASEGDVRGTVTVVVIANLCASLGGIHDHRVTAVLLMVSGLLGGLSGGNLFGAVAGVGVGAVVIFSVRVSLWLLGVVTELDAARLTQGQLAVAEERLRFSRDVHDVLGRRLSTIAVQSELAATLAARGDDRAAERMLEVRGVAHEALNEARELARGYRPTNLPHEVEGARSLLRSAGIDVEVALDVVPRAWHEAAGWVVRESVTNVLRHSDARLVRISYRSGELRVDSDGVRPDDRDDLDGDGSGLQGVRDRLQPLGASLLTHQIGANWSVVAHMPGAGPISATTGSTDPSKDMPT